MANSRMSAKLTRVNLFVVPFLMRPDAIGLR
jgi:hypothetical protein